MLCVNLGRRIRSRIRPLGSEGPFFIPREGPKKMTSEKQAAANRRNAQRSTGPHTDRGKARAAMNNVQSEIIPGEDLAEREALAEAYMERFAPDTIELLHLVQVLIRLDCEETRLAKAE